MNTYLKHPVLFFRSVSQSFFFENALFGVLFLALFAVFRIDFFVCGLAASLIGYLYSVRHSVPKALRASGLITINCFFFGISMASLFHKNLPFYACLALGSLALPVITKAVYEVLQHWKLSPLVIPYILVTWVIWLCGQGAALGLETEPWPDYIHSLPALNPDGTLQYRLAWAVLQSMGRLLFLPDPLFGFSLLLLVLVFHPKRGLYFLLGSAIATMAALALSGDSFAWEYGYYSYSAGLVGLGLASFSEKFTLRTIVLFCGFSSVLTMALDQFLTGMQLPSLSLPYVVTMWILLLSRAPRLSLSWEPDRFSSVQGRDFATAQSLRFIESPPFPSDQQKIQEQEEVA